MVGQVKVLRSVFTIIGFTVSIVKIGFQEWIAHVSESRMAKNSKL
jgi:hypothetical protein